MKTKTYKAAKELNCPMKSLFSLAANLTNYSLFILQLFGL